MGFKREFLDIFSMHKIEFALMFIATLPFLLFLIDDIKPYYTYYAYSGALFVATYLSNKSKLYKFIPIFIAIFYTILYVYIDSFKHFIQDDRFLILNLIATLILVSFPFYKDDYKFINSLFTIAIAIIFASVFMLGIYVIIISIIESIEYLFGVEFYSQIYLNIFFILLFSALPAIFLYFSNTKTNFNFNKISTLFFNIISSALVIYSILLFTYFIYIIFNLELPRGMLSSIILPYLYFGFGLYFIDRVYKSKFDILYRYFGFIAIIPLSILYVAILRRLYDYGFTIDRFYILILAVLATIFCVFAIFKFKIRAFFMATILLFLVSFFVINPKTISTNSQMKRFEGILKEFNALNKDGSIKDEFDIQKINSAKANELRNIAFALYKFDNYSTKKYEKIYTKDKFLQIFNFSNSKTMPFEYSFKADNNFDINLEKYSNIKFIKSHISQNDIDFNATNGIINFRADEFIRDIFIKNGLDINKHYDTKELQRYKFDFLQKRYDSGILFFTEFNIVYNHNKYEFLNASNAFFIAK